MRLWWTSGGCELEAPSDHSAGVHLVLDRDGVAARSPLGRPSAKTYEEPFSGLADRDEITAALARLELLDAARSADGRHVVLLNDHGKATLDGSMWPGSIALESKGAKAVTWPKGLLWTGKAPRSRARKMSCQRGQIHLRTAGDAIAITCMHTGVVALFRGGASSPALLRLPLERGVELRATPTVDGVLVTLVTADGRGALVHCTANGKVLASAPLASMLAAIPTADGSIIILSDAGPEGQAEPGHAQLHRLRLRDLTPLTPAEDLPLRARALAVSDEGRIALSDGAQVILGRWSEEGLSLGPTIAVEPGDSADSTDSADPAMQEATTSATTEVDTDTNTATVPSSPVESSTHAPPADPPPEAPCAPSSGYVANALDAEPALGLASGGPPAPGWSGSVGAPFEITLRLRSLGRASRGLTIEVGGEALARGLIQLDEIRADDQVARLAPAQAGMRKASLLSTPIPAGVRAATEPLSPAQQADAADAMAASHVEVTILGRGIRPGSGLLALRITAAESTGSCFRRLRPVAIR